MNTDLTCPECEGSGLIRLGTEEHGDDLACLRCGGVGRRSFTMQEWDALVAERDRYHVALEVIRRLSGVRAPTTPKPTVRVWTPPIPPRVELVHSARIRRLRRLRLSGLATDSRTRRRATPRGITAQELH